MNPRLRRILLILLLLLFVLGTFLLTWFLFFRPFVQPLTNGNGNVNDGGGGPLPNVNDGRNVNGTNQPLAIGGGALPLPSEIANGDLTLATSLTQQTAIAPTTAADGKNVAFYDDVRDRFVRLDPETGTIVELSTQRFPDVEEVTWSPDRTKAVLEFPDESKIVYDFSAQRQYSLPQQGEEFSFSGDSAKIAYEYVGNGPDETFLVTSDINGTNTKAVTKLGEKKDQVQVAWSPTDEVVALFRQGIDVDQQEVVLVGQNQENFKSIMTDGRGFQGKWTPDGSKLLYTVYSEATNWNPELYLVHARGEATGQGKVSLGLSTFLDKCTFNRNGTHAYCAVPDILERGSGLYPEFASTVKDAFYTVNLQTGDTKALAQPVTGTYERFTVASVFLSDDERTLFFTDAATRRVHKLRLK